MGHLRSRGAGTVESTRLPGRSLWLRLSPGSEPRPKGAVFIPLATGVLGDGDAPHANGGIIRSAPRAATIREDEASSGELFCRRQECRRQRLAKSVQPGRHECLRHLAPLLLLTIVGCSGPYSGAPVAAKESTPPITVKVQTAALETIPEVITATGELLAEESATISAKVPGRVEKLLVDLGSVVRAGDVLAELERDDYDVHVRQAAASVEQTRARLGIGGTAGDSVVPEETAIVRAAAANLKEARLIFANTSKLFAEGVVSRVDFEKGQVNVQGSEARYQAALEEVAQLRALLIERRAQLALARQHLADCEIRAPFAGAVTRRIASLGEYLAVNGGVVMLVRQHPLRLRLEVPERLAAKIRAGQRIDVGIVGSASGRTGRVVRMSPAIDAQNRSLVIEGEIPNQDGALRPGSFAEGTITVDANARGIAVPGGAIIAFAGIERVFVVNNGALDEKIVRTGRRLRDGRIEILTGVEPGDRVVRDASDRMAKGQAVTAAGG